jgi:NTF2 fold immunity protein
MLKFLCCVIFFASLFNLNCVGASEKNIMKQIQGDRGYTPKEGFLPTKEVALAIAEILLVEVYGNQAIQAQKPFSATLSENIWNIEGKFSGGKFDKGGVARIKLSKLDGRVLYLMHDK